MLLMKRKIGNATNILKAKGIWLSVFGITIYLQTSKVYCKD